MKSWHIWNFPGTVYASLNDNFREEFFNYLFDKFGGKRPAARFLGISQTAIKQYSAGYTWKNGIKHPQAIPIGFLNKCEKIIDEEMKRKVEVNIRSLKAKNRGISVINPKLPIAEFPAFYRVVAHMIGDGSASPRKVPYYANTCRELREQFKEDLKIFGDVRVYDSKTNIPIVCFPKVITDVLAHVLDVRFSFPDRIPKQIFNASDECRSAFLQALFDDEGCCSTSLALAMSNQNLVSEIKLLVESLGVKTNSISLKKNRNWKDNFTIQIKSSSIPDFREKIGFSHPEKIRNLNFAISTQNRSQRTRDMDELKMQILKIIGDNSLKTLDIANNIQLGLRHTLKYLKELENENRIFRSGFKNKIIWSLAKASTIE